jgi:hypothetical protein
MSVIDNAPASAAAAPVAPSAPAVSYPEDYEDIRRQNAEYRAALEALQPYAEDIRPIIEDEDTRSFLREARTTYQRQKQDREPKLSPELQMLREDLVKEAGPAVAWVNEQRAAAEQAKKEAEESAQRANVLYAQRLAAERPDLAEDNFAGIGMIAAYAAARGMSLEEAYKTTGSRLAAPPAKKEPPTSLRGESAAPGVPGPSEQPKATSLGQLRTRLAANMRAGMKG